MKLYLGYFLLIVAYVLLLPGVTEPVLHVTTTLDKAELAVLGKEALLESGTIPDFLMPITMQVLNQVQVSGTVVVTDTAKSILQTSQDLWSDGYELVAFLIVFFSIFVPVLKLGLLVASWFIKPLKNSLAKSSAFLSKWSMADVFVMALLISYLAIKASSGNSALVTTEITLESGFYYFLGYCLVSILASQFLLTTLNHRHNNATPNRYLKKTSEL